MQTLKTVKIGNLLSPETVHIPDSGPRTPAQLEAVCKWHAENPSAWWCINPFEPDENGRSYKCSFAHTYFGIDGSMHSVWVTPTGKLEKRSKSDKYDGRWMAETDAVIAAHGSFSGQR